MIEFCKPVAQILIKELLMIFHTSDISICNSNIKDPIGTSTFYTIRSSSSMFPLLLLLPTLEVYECYLQTFLPQAGEI